MANTNIPQKIYEAIIYIMALDDLQRSQGLGGIGTFKWQDWHWTEEESLFWHNMREIVAPLLEPYANKKIITTGQRNTIKITIKTLREYAGYDVGGHRLLFKIIAHGEYSDWAVANIKLGTPLAKKSGYHKSDSTEMLQPTVIIRKNIIGEMELMVYNPNTPTSRRLPDGMKFAKVYRYIGTEPAKSVNDFIFCGNAFRGKLCVNFAGVDQSSNVVLYAWYFARYESNKGELGAHGAMANAQIIYQCL